MQTFPLFSLVDALFSLVDALGAVEEGSGRDSLGGWAHALLLHCVVSEYGLAHWPKAVE